VATNCEEREARRVILAPYPPELSKSIL
jgi:hypothetical protein